MNEFDRNIEHSKLHENTLNKRMFIKDIGVEDMVIQKIEKEQLYHAINSLLLKQKSRLHKYFLKI